MIARIIGFILLGLIASYLAIWLLSGGWSRTAALAHSYGNPFTIFKSGFTLEGAWFQLPWQVPLPLGPSLDAIGDIPTDTQDQWQQQEQGQEQINTAETKKLLNDLQTQYDRIKQQLERQGLIEPQH